MVLLGLTHTLSRFPDHGKNHPAEYQAYIAIIKVLFLAHRTTNMCDKELATSHTRYTRKEQAVEKTIEGHEGQSQVRMPIHRIADVM